MSSGLSACFPYNFLVILLQHRHLLGLRQIHFYHSIKMQINELAYGSIKRRYIIKWTGTLPKDCQPETLLRTTGAHTDVMKHDGNMTTTVRRKKTTWIGIRLGRVHSIETSRSVILSGSNK